MKKKDLQRTLDLYENRLKFKCIHGHNGFSHPNCYVQDKAIEHRIGFFDIETSDLLADWGFVLSYCIKAKGGKIIKRLISPEEVLSHKKKDKNLIRQFCMDVLDFDILVVYYGKDTGGRYQRHDIPFMRTRAIKWKLRNFPKQSDLIIIDMYDVVKSKLKMKRNSMEYACKLCGITSKTTPHNFEIWQQARDGNRSALNKILKHNEEDVISLEDLYNVIYEYKQVKTQI